MERLRKLVPIAALALLPLAGCDQPSPEGEVGPVPDEADAGGEADDASY
jgi:hypothetical protein